MKNSIPYVKINKSFNRTISFQRYDLGFRFTVYFNLFLLRVQPVLFIIKQKSITCNVS